MSGVSPAALMEYPKELTDADWQKKKGLMAKAVKTGLGAELKKGEALHKKVDTAMLSADNNAPKSMEDLEAGIAGAKKHYGDAVDPLIKQLKTIVAEAKSAEAAMTKGKYKDAATAAAAIAKKADLFSVTCKSVDLEASIKRGKERVDKLNVIAAKMLTESIKKFLVSTKVFLAGDGSKDSWDENVKQNGRSVSNSVRQLKNYNAAFWKDFQKFDGFDLSAMKLNDDEDKSKERRLKLCRDAIKQVVDIAKFKG
jgi:hypothetical protein